MRAWPVFSDSRSAHGRAGLNPGGGMIGSTVRGWVWGWVWAWAWDMRG